MRDVRSSYTVHLPIYVTICICLPIKIYPKSVILKIMFNLQNGNNKMHLILMLTIILKNTHMATSL